MENNRVGLRIIFPSTPSCAVWVRGIFIALDSKNGNVWLALPCSGSQTKPAFWRADRGVMKRDASRWRRSNLQPLHALCLVRPLSQGGKLRNIRPASKVAYATTDIIVFSKRFYKIPLGLRVQHRIFTTKESLQEQTWASTALKHGGGASGVEWGFQERAYVVQHLITWSLRRAHGSQGLGEANGCCPSGRSLSLANYSTFCDMCLNYASLRVTAWVCDAGWCWAIGDNREHTAQPPAVLLH